MRGERFSTRHGYADRDKPILTREEASKGLRHFIADTVYELGNQPSFLRRIVCRALDEVPDESNWSERPNIEGEVHQLLAQCEWYFIYDIIEDVAYELDQSRKAEFHQAMNDYFRRRGIGWKLENSQILFRGDDAFEENLDKAEEALVNAGKQTAATEIKEAIRDLSRKPEADITGAIQHSLACLECISREVVGDKKATLGELIRKHRSIVPSPLDVVIEKAWGYSSEQGRHLQEGREPSLDEAELMVGLSAVLSTYMARKLTPIQSQTIHSSENIERDLPF